VDLVTLDKWVAMDYREARLKEVVDMAVRPFTGFSAPSEVDPPGCILP
jgi:hypothetical protein